VRARLFWKSKLSCRVKKKERDKRAGSQGFIPGGSLEEDHMTGW
jgi:hypothetical protein